ncbi:hypothetical protein BLNAU_1229 [Blattamonas nauphoetae]|uniref:Uncharacterized protein n=1 Tax=Blattamonas nauphoetae TaxID=2049346 RepID=A0ABQ9YJA1_9EUKA|nr:hypothetical protein BLNAU_1229 [Blattamonas nauphoetae]
MSRSMNTPLSFATTLALLVSGRQTSIDGWMVTIGGSFRSEGSEDVIAEFMAVLDSCSVATHTLPLPSATPSPPTPSLCLCLSLTTHTLPLSSASPSPPTPSHSPLPLPHHPHPPTLLCLSLTTHTLPLSSASPSPRTPSHSPLPLPHHPHPPTPLCLSVTTHTISLPSASPSPHSVWRMLILDVPDPIRTSLDRLPPSLSLNQIPIPSGREVQKDETGRGEQRQADIQKRRDTEDKLRSGNRKSESMSCRKEMRKAGEDESSEEGERKTRNVKLQSALDDSLPTK